MDTEIDAFDIVLNEYITPDTKRLLKNGFYEIFYEPLEKKAESLTGIVYLKNVEDIFFYNKNYKNKKLLFNNLKNIISGKFFCKESLISIIWKKDPGQHFLCVSYEYKYDNYKENNWKSEGF